MWNDPFTINDGDSEGTVFRDVILLALGGFMVIVMLLLPHVNPHGNQNDGDQLLPGNLVVEITWPDDLNTDVDLWVQAPGDRPVGYSNKGGLYFNLLRDDLGTQTDVSDLNFENAYSRGIPEGEYTVNVHLYRNNSGKLPIPVRVTVGIKKNPDAGLVYYLNRKVYLKYQGQELTVFRFTVDSNKAILKSTVHDLPKPLRSRKNSE